MTNKRVLHILFKIMLWYNKLHIYYSKCIYSFKQYLDKLQDNILLWMLQLKIALKHGWLSISPPITICTNVTTIYIT